jgi:low affinity Fe/Cu permease
MTGKETSSVAKRRIPSSNEFGHDGPALACFISTGCQNPRPPMENEPASSAKNNSVPQRRRIEHRTAHLPIWSRILYKIEHYTVLPVVALVAIVAVASMAVLIAVLGFPSRWVAGFEVAIASVTLVMVFAIQHTQGREQAATQRKLDELIRAVPGADEAFMMLEEAPQRFMLEVEGEQREIRSNSSEVGMQSPL